MMKLLVFLALGALLTTMAEGRAPERADRPAAVQMAAAGRL
jgi:hypothetical protein